MKLNTIITSDALAGLKTLPDDCVDCCVTSIPYYALRDYGVEGQIGLERTIDEWVDKIVQVFDEVKRVLKPTGTCWINIGDAYNGSGKGSGDTTGSKWKQATNKGSRENNKLLPRKEFGMKPKDLMGQPWLVAFALRNAGWYLRQDIIWHKPNPMPESVTDRCTKSHEYIFLLTKSPKYFYDAEAIKTEAKELYHMVPNGWAVGQGSHDTKDHATPEGRERKIKNLQSKGQQNNTLHEQRLTDGVVSNAISKVNKRSVWTITPKPYREAHFATFPEDLVIPCIKAGSSEYGCCDYCGAPFERVIDKKLVPTAKASHNSQVDERDINADLMDQGSNRQKDGHKPGHINETKTIGWTRTCFCLGRGDEYGKYDIKPALVLDPFMGAGTTALTALKLGRNFIGFELNPKYTAMAMKRIEPYLLQTKLF